VFDWLFASRRGEDVSEHETGFEPVRTALTVGLGDKQWLTGDSFTVADLLCGTMLANAYQRELLTDDGPLRSFAERTQARPAAQRAHAIDASHR
jgi:glutathione S-transferase